MMSILRPKEIKQLLSALIIIFVICLSGCGEKGADKKTIVYMEKAGDSTHNWLKLERGNGTTICTFCGHDTLSNGTAIYYWAEGESLRISQDSISFRLNYYNLSLKPYGQPIVPFERTELRKEPYSVVFSQIFHGTISNNTMKLIRASIVDNNRFERVTLTKIDNR